MMRAEGESQELGERQASWAGEVSGRSDDTNGWDAHKGGGTGQAWKQQRAATTVLVNLSAIMERSDEQLLPAVYAFVAASFGASPKQLGYLTQCRALVQALTSPFGGLAGHYFNRVWVVAVGCTIWGCMTALFSACTGLAQGYALWAINGVGLSLVVPTGQSLTADYFSESARGRAFGALYLTGALGAMLGGIYATNLGGHHVLGVEGWRVAFASVAVVSLVIGALNLALARDPRCATRWGLRQDAEGQVDRGTLLRELQSMCCMRTFLLIIAQGIVGSTPWNALVFLTLYLQTLGMSDGVASGLLAAFLGATAVGGLLGGWLGDLGAAASPTKGRIAVCQFSVFAGVPLSFVLFKALPMNGDAATAALYAICLVCMGALISWAAPACNNPIFSEIVPPHLRTVVYAFDRSFESAVAASAAPIVGALAEAFGWQGTASPKSGSVETNLENAKALGNAMLLCTTVPWALCGVFYTGLYFTYPADRAAAAAAAAAAADVSPQDAIRPGGGAKPGSPPAPRLGGGDETSRLLPGGGKRPPALELAAVGGSASGPDPPPREAEGTRLLPGGERSDG